MSNLKLQKGPISNGTTSPRASRGQNKFDYFALVRKIVRTNKCKLLTRSQNAQDFFD
jgi:hypothetical protein